MADATGGRAPGLRTSPETREALRDRYREYDEFGQGPPCPVCGKAMGRSHLRQPDAGRQVSWRCGDAHPIEWAVTGPADADVLAVCDDADALAGALAELEGLRSGLAFYKPEAERYRAALKRIQGWDCLNPPQADLCADLPWLRRLVDEALEPDPAANTGLDAPRMPLGLREGEKRAKSTGESGAGATAHPGAIPGEGDGR